MRTFLAFLTLGVLSASSSYNASADFINVIAATATNNQSGSALATANGSGFTPDALGSDLGSHVANIGTHWVGGPGTGISRYLYVYPPQFVLPI